MHMHMHLHALLMQVCRCIIPVCEGMHIEPAKYAVAEP